MAGGRGGGGGGVRGSGEGSLGSPLRHDGGRGGVLNSGCRVCSYNGLPRTESMGYRGQGNVRGKRTEYLVLVTDRLRASLAPAPCTPATSPTYTVPSVSRVRRTPTHLLLPQLLEAAQHRLGAAAEDLVDAREHRQQLVHLAVRQLGHNVRQEGQVVRVRLRGRGRREQGQRVTSNARERTSRCTRPHSPTLLPYTWQYAGTGSCVAPLPLPRWRGSSRRPAA